MWLVLLWLLATAILVTWCQKLGLQWWRWVEAADCKNYTWAVVSLARVGGERRILMRDYG